jgi:ribosome-associated heat shock protein Hsp15
MSVRLDKWLHVARMYKTRTKATDACDLGRVQVNGQTAKPHRHLNPGDRIELTQGDWNRILIVKELKDKPVAKAEAPLLYEDQSPPKPAPDPLARLLRRPPVLREAGSGRPTKKDRREMEEWEKGSAEPIPDDDDPWD